MGDLFQQGPSPEQRRQEFHRQASQISLQDLTPARLFEIANELGAKNPGLLVEDFYKLQKQNQSLKKEMLSEQEGMQIRQFLETLPRFAPRFDPSKPSVPITPEELTSMVSAVGGLQLDQSQRFMESARTQDVGRRFQVTSPLQGFERLPPDVIGGPTGFTSKLLEAQFLPKLPYENLSEIDLSVKAAQGDTFAQKILDDLQARKVEISAQQGVGKERLQRTLPLTPEKRSELVNPDDLTSPPIGTTEDQAIKQGYVKIRPEDKQKLADFSSTEVLINSLFGLADQLISATTAVEAIKQGTSLTAGAISKSNPTAAAYRDLRASFAGTLSRSLASERGVLTDRDITRVVNAFPAFNDTVPVKEYKKGLINLLFRRTFEETKAAATGQPRNQKKWRGELEAMINVLSGKQIGITREGKPVIELPDGTRKVIE